jgi:glycosyltransferase involved in cell wall biosynthesis
MGSLIVQPIISCIVCTYNRQDFILQCLEALSLQSLAPKEFEVIVVDNRSKDKTAELVRGFIQDHPKVQMAYVLEEEQGLSFARNRGAKTAEEISLHTLTMTRLQILTYWRKC